MRGYRWTAVAAAVCATVGCVAPAQMSSDEDLDSRISGGLAGAGREGDPRRASGGDIALVSAESPGERTTPSQGVPPEVVRILVDQIGEATPQEREELYQALLRVQPEHMGDVLQAWRMGRAASRGLAGAPDASVGMVPEAGVVREVGTAAGGAPRLPMDDARFTQRGGLAAPAAPEPSLVMLGAPQPHAAGRPAGDPGPNPFDSAPEFSDPLASRILPVSGSSGSAPRLPLPSDYTRPGETGGAGGGAAPPLRPESPLIAASSVPGHPHEAGAIGAAGPQQVAAVDQDPVYIASRSASPGWRGELERLIATVESEVATGGGANSIEQQIYLRMLYTVAGRREQAATPIAGLAPAEQEFWQNVLLGFSAYLDDETIPRPADRAAEAVEQIGVALARLRETAPLSVSNLAFCRQIESYGVYEAFPENAFEAGQQVLLYAEVENFASEQTAAGHRTVLRSMLEILDANGQQVWHQEFPETEDVCRNPRRDYFHSYRFDMPPNIYAGRYTLKLRVEDQLVHKVAEGMIEFTIE